MIQMLVSYLIGKKENFTFSKIIYHYADDPFGYVNVLSETFVVAYDYICCCFDKKWLACKTETDWRIEISDQ